MLGMPLEAWVIGVIVILVGLLAVICSFVQEELGSALAVAGVSSAFIGSIVFINSFRKWVEHFC